jgi:hypothetical protein
MANILAVLVPGDGTLRLAAWLVVKFQFGHWVVPRRLVSSYN